MNCAGPGCADQAHRRHRAAALRHRLRLHPGARPVCAQHRAGTARALRPGLLQLHFAPLCRGLLNYTRGRVNVLPLGRAQRQALAGAYRSGARRRQEGAGRLRLRKTKDGEWKAYDVIIEGISTSPTTATRWRRRSRSRAWKRSPRGWRRRATRRWTASKERQTAVSAPAELRIEAAAATRSPSAGTGVWQRRGLPAAHPRGVGRACGARFFSAGVSRADSAGWPYCWRWRRKTARPGAPVRLRGVPAGLPRLPTSARWNRCSARRRATGIVLARLSHAWCRPCVHYFCCSSSSSSGSKFWSTPASAG